MFENVESRSQFFQVFFALIYLFQAKQVPSYVAIESYSIDAWLTLLSVLFPEAIFHVYGPLMMTIPEPFRNRIVHHKSSLPHLTPEFTRDNTIYINTDSSSPRADMKERDALLSKFGNVCLLQKDSKIASTDLRIVTPWVSTGNASVLLGVQMNKEAESLLEIAQKSRFQQYLTPRSPYFDVPYPVQSFYDFALEEELMVNYFARRSIDANEVNLFALKSSVERVTEKAKLLFESIDIYYSDIPEIQQKFTESGLSIAKNPLEATVVVNSDFKRFRSDKFLSIGALHYEFDSDLHRTLKKRCYELYGPNSLSAASGFIMPIREFDIPEPNGYTYEYDAEKGEWVPEQSQFQDDSIIVPIGISSQGAIVNIDRARKEGELLSQMTKKHAAIFIAPIANFLKTLFCFTDLREFIVLDVRIRIRNDYMPLIDLQQTSISVDSFSSARELLSKLITE